MSKFIMKNNDPELEALIAKTRHLLKVIDGFDWDAFNASRGADMDIDIEFAPSVAYITYWDNNYDVIKDTTMYAETLYPIPLTRAIEVFKPEFAAGANVNFESVDGRLTDTVVFKFH